MRAQTHNKCTSKTYTERRAERARFKVEDKDVLNFLVLLVDTQLTSNTDFYQTSAKETKLGRLLLRYGQPTSATTNI